MIFGIGTDLAYIPRFCRILSQSGSYRERFLRKACHPDEINRIENIMRRQGSEGKGLTAQAVYLAGRWAAKEALTKALGTRFLFPEIQVQSKEPHPDSGLNGKAPVITAHGKAKELLISRGIKPTLSISHDGDYAVAFVIVFKSD